MMKIVYLVMLAVPGYAAVNSPLEADFPAGYWERESLVYVNAATTYNISVAAKEPAALRAQIETLGKASNATLTGFSDQTPYLSAVSGSSRIYPVSSVMYGDYPAMPRIRQAYSLTYKLPASTAGEVARRIADLGRLISYSANTPYGVSQMRELDDKIEWIEREQKEAANALKTMPVSRAMLEAKLKLLKQNKDSVKASEGVATITVQIILDEAEKAEDSPATEHKQKRKHKQ